jgi:hypothetical protein
VAAAGAAGPVGGRVADAAGPVGGSAADAAGPVGGRVADAARPAWARSGGVGASGGAGASGGGVGWKAATLAADALVVVMLAAMAAAGLGRALDYPQVVAALAWLVPVGHRLAVALVLVLAALAVGAAMGPATAEPFQLELVFDGPVPWRVGLGGPLRRHWLGLALVFLTGAGVVSAMMAAAGMAPWDLPGGAGGPGAAGASVWAGLGWGLGWLGGGVAAAAAWLFGQRFQALGRTAGLALLALALAASLGPDLGAGGLGGAGGSPQLAEWVALSVVGLAGVAGCLAAPRLLDSLDPSATRLQAARWSAARLGVGTGYGSEVGRAYEALPSRSAGRSRRSAGTAAGARAGPTAGLEAGKEAGVTTGPMAGTAAGATAGIAAGSAGCRAWPGRRWWSGVIGLDGIGLLRTPGRLVAALGLAVLGGVWLAEALAGTAAAVGGEGGGMFRPAVLAGLGCVAAGAGASWLSGGLRHLVDDAQSPSTYGVSAAPLAAAHALTPLVGTALGVGLGGLANCLAGGLSAGIGWAPGLIAVWLTAAELVALSVLERAGDASPRAFDVSMYTPMGDPAPVLRAAWLVWPQLAAASWGAGAALAISACPSGLALAAMAVVAALTVRSGLRKLRSGGPL